MNFLRLFVSANCNLAAASTVIISEIRSRRVENAAENASVCETCPAETQFRKRRKFYVIFAALHRVYRAADEKRCYYAREMEIGRVKRNFTAFDTDLQRIARAITVFDNSFIFRRSKISGILVL